jgi:hypothetical protein
VVLAPFNAQLEFRLHPPACAGCDGKKFAADLGKRRHKFGQCVSHLCPSSMAEAQPILNRSAPIIMRRKIRNGSSGELFDMWRAIRWMMAAFVCALAAAPVAAQEADEAAYAVTSPSANSTDTAPPADTPLTPDESAVLGNALLFDPAHLADAKPAKPLRLPNLNGADKFDVSRTDKPDGSSTVVVKQPLANEWDAKVGADLSHAATSSDGYRPSKPFPVTADGERSGAAWASVGLPNLISLDARVDPAKDQGKLGATIKKSIPLGDKFSVTLQDSYSVTETFSPPATTPSDLPLMTAPTVAALPAPQVRASQKAIKFDILGTGTTLGAGLTTASNDPVTHNTLSADQKLYGPLHVTTAVTNVGQAGSSKSISAGLKLNW